MLASADALIQSKFKVRNFTWDDLPALVEFLNLVNERDGHEEEVLAEELELELRSPTSDPEKDMLLVFTSENQLIASGDLQIDPARYKGHGDGEVHPDYRGQGIGTYFIRTQEECFFNAVKDEIQGDQPIYIQRWTLDKVTSASELFEKEGYQHVRTFYQMRIKFDEQLAPVAMPEGYELRPFDKERDAYKVYQAQQEAFRDHWGYTQDVTFEEWSHWRFNDFSYKPDLWLVAWHGDEVAGSAICRPFGPDIPDLAWVGTLSVRRPYRKTGLGSALLRQSFYIFQQQGFKQAGLGVDAENKTNALALYERAGMNVHKRFVNYRKVLRGNPELIKD